MNVSTSKVKTNGNTFEYDETLPKLPLPSLKSTLEKYAIILEPFCSNDLEVKDLHAKVNELIDKVGRSSSVGEKNNSMPLLKLQQLLQKRHSETSNYIDEWWRDYAYLNDRSVRVPVEAFVPRFPDNPSNVPMMQLERAAQITYAAASIMLKVRFGELEVVKNKGVPVSMKQYKYIYQLRNFKTTQELSPDKWYNLGYMILACRAQFYKFPLSLFDKNLQAHRPLTLEEINKALLICWEDSLKCSIEKRYHVAVLTGTDRDTWTECRELLIKNPVNRISLETIEEAAFVLNLDPSKPEEVADRIKETAIGKNAGTRWYDNGMQWIVYANGHVGYAMEHSQLDALPVVKIHEEMYKILETADIWASGSTYSNMLKDDMIRKLEWDIPELVQRKIEASFLTYQKIYDSWIVDCKRLNGLGTQILKSNGFSPDSFMQICFQLAYYRLWNRLPSVYETVVTTSFRDGRTEAGRSVTKASADFVSSFDKDTKTIDDMVKGLRDACLSHTQRVSEARNGKGVDRHIFALHQCARLNGIGDIPNILDTSKNELYRRASCWDLSTSHVTSPKCSAIDHSIAFHPVGVDSIGIVYSMYPYCIDFTIMTDANSEKTDGNAFMKEAHNAFYDLVYLILRQSNL